MKPTANRPKRRSQRRVDAAHNLANTVSTEHPEELRKCRRRVRNIIVSDSESQAESDTHVVRFNDDDDDDDFDEEEEYEEEDINVNEDNDEDDELRELENKRRRKSFGRPPPANDDKDHIMRLEFERLGVNDPDIRDIEKDIDSVVVITSSLIAKRKEYPTNQSKTFSVLDPSKKLTWFSFIMGTDTLVPLGMKRHTPVRSMHETFVDQVIIAAAEKSTGKQSKSNFTYGDNRANPSIFAQEWEDF
ncbi:hypothetical protein TSAR_004534 [Trichomalopsis sarcophagae]|uniref:Uncharacterized protein n=1 Tax=Trichomalopsis sarcophagae TaxID=543379 RepID=A0A232EMF1_9HYME|nr:hypothetical protein TSAR_004534 [Trichomalopsis sarcophagae]